MLKDFQALTYVVDDNVADTIRWLLSHQECFDVLHYDAVQQQLFVDHANGTDIIQSGQYLNAQYGILITS